MANDIIILVQIDGNVVSDVSLSSFGKPRVTYGRASDNDIKIKSSYVSEHHGCFVQDSSGAWSIRDNGSRNGTILGGSRITGVPLADGQQFYLGDPSFIHRESVSFVVRRSSSVSTGPAPRDKGADTVTMVSILDGDRPVRTVDLSRFGKNKITFGRDEDNDIVLTSESASGHHGSICLDASGCTIIDENSRSGLLFGGQRLPSLRVTDGTVVRIDNPDSPFRRGISLLFTSGRGEKWESLDISSLDDIIIGRDPGCTLCLDRVSVSRRHARIFREGGRWFIEDLGSTNGLSVNGRIVDRRLPLKEMDLIIITDIKLVFTSTCLNYVRSTRGLQVDAIDIVRTVGKGGKRKNISDHITLSIKPGEFVGIIGTSGAGKSTFLNCISGYVKADSGTVLINGQNLYQNYQVMKSIIGYVPQQDIVYDNLTLKDMLDYAAKLRMPSDTGKAELEKRVAEVISTVELTGHENTFIKQLSGGQKKRASIAVELLSDPRLFFLDEPTSGLDPGTERNLMHTLRNMTAEGKTVVLVTHNTLNLHLCDKIIFLGNGGRLCFCGAPDDALKFFGTENLVDVYNLLEKGSKEWSAKYSASPYRSVPETGKGPSRSVTDGKKKGQKFFGQLRILSARYLKLLTNDRQRLVLLLFQAVLLAFLLYLVSNGDQFEEYKITKSIVFALACSAFWIGILNAIQEICKEWVILKREYVSFLNLGAYILSKFVVLGLFCLIQTVLLTGGFAAMVGIPEEGVMFPPLIEFTITTYLCMLSAMGMGLLVSTMFQNPDRAMTVAPILLMPQILFSGLAFKWEGVVKSISYVVSCRWAVEAYGTTANMNALPIDYDLPEGMPVPEREFEEFYEFTTEHLLFAWGILAAMLLIFALASFIMLKHNLKNGKN